MRRASALGLLLALCCGCFSTSRPDTKSWTVEPAAGMVRENRPEEGTPAFVTTRMGGISVCAPYDRTAFVVRRPDGSVAFDAYNEFAASPSTLLRAPVMSQLAADGRFGRVVAPSSVAGADAAVEVLVRDISLDCRDGSRRTARAAVSVDVVKTGRGARVVALSGDGTSESDASAGDYSTAFSEAFNEALAAALRALK